MAVEGHKSTTLHLLPRLLILHLNRFSYHGASGVLSKVGGWQLVGCWLVGGLVGWLVGWRLIDCWLLVGWLAILRCMCMLFVFHGRWLAGSLAAVCCMCLLLQDLGRWLCAVYCMCRC